MKPAQCKGAGRSDFGETAEVGAQHVALEHKVGELAIRTISIRPAFSSALRWWESVGAPIFCPLRNVVQAIGSEDEPMSFKIS